MEDDDFVDLFAETELIKGSSQESLTGKAANLEFCEDCNDPNPLQTWSDTPPTTVEIQDASQVEIDNDNELLNHMCDSTKRSDRDRYVESERTYPQLKDRTKSNVIERIEAVFNEMLGALANEKNELAIVISRRVTTSGTSASTDMTSLNASVKRTRKICFPGKSAEEAWRFTIITRILELMHEALRNDVVLSKRDIFYRDPALFGKQAHVDRYVDDIAFTFDVPRSTLNVTAAAKGLIAGAVQFCRRDGSAINAADCREGMLVPPLREILSVDMAAIKWILVIEKEATFRSVAASSFWDVTSTNGVLLTGKGYPDVASRALLHFLSTPSPQNGFASPPVHALVDFDPDGLAIFSIYKHGALAMSHENLNLRVPQLQLFGLRSEHMFLNEDDVHGSQGLLTLTARDRRKAVKMLERCVSSEGDEGEDSQFRQDLQTMLMFGVKAELQLLDGRPNDMTNLLISRLGRL